MRFWLSVVLGTAVFPLKAAESPFVLAYEQWAVPRQGDTVLALPAVRAAVGELQRHPRGELVIRYPGGEEGVLWANELQSWLVALGIASSRVELRPGSPDPEALTLEVSVRGAQR